MIVYHAYRTDDSDFYQWIGLRNTNEPCACDDMKPFEECEECRNRWTWTDGTHATPFHSWLSFEPAYDTDLCAVTTQSSDFEDDPGSWITGPCDFELSFICKKGKRYIIFKKRLAVALIFNLSTCEHL